MTALIAPICPHIGAQAAGGARCAVGRGVGGSWGRGTRVPHWVLRGSTPAQAWARCYVRGVVCRRAGPDFHRGFCQGQRQHRGGGEFLTSKSAAVFPGAGSEVLDQRL
jgi:hypothetical protein